MTRLTTALAVSLLFLVSSIPSTAQILASEPDRREAIKHYRSGQDYLSRERWQEAAEAFQEAIRFDRLLTDAHYGLGQAYMGLRRYTSAIQAFERCIEAARDLHMLRERARARIDRAIDDEIRELRDSVRRISAGHQRVTQPNIKITQLQQRIDELERSRSSIGGPFEAPATVLLSLGSAHFRNGARAEAEHYWAEAVKVNSRLGEAWNNLAVIYMSSGRKQDAEMAVSNAERAGFRVHPGLKDDIRAMKD
jgi:tetratricopeptide (TPR) repeat protein